MPRVRKHSCTSIERCIVLKAIKHKPANNDIHKPSQPYNNSRRRKAKKRYKRNKSNNIKSLQKNIMQKNHLTRKSVRAHEQNYTRKKKWKKCIRHKLYSLVWYFDFLLSFVLISVVVVVFCTFGSIFCDCCFCAFLLFVAVVFAAVDFLVVLSIALLSRSRSLWPFFFFCCDLPFSFERERKHIKLIFCLKSPSYKSNTINYYALLLSGFRIFVLFISTCVQVSGFLFAILSIRTHIVSGSVNSHSQFL